MLVVSNWPWIVILFPLWTILVSTYILVVTRESKHDG
jgi:hypothetical protein